MLLIARAVARRRWVALVGLGLVAGLAGATVTSAAALARRTGTAYDRLEAATAPGDVTMFALAGDEAAERVAALPGVEAAWMARAGVAALGDTPNYLGLTAGPPPGNHLRGFHQAGGGSSTAGAEAAVQSFPSSTVTSR